jgi:hypothetical protein
MSDGRFTMRGYAFQGYASAPWALAGGVAAVVRTGSGRMDAGQISRYGIISAEVRTAGLVAGQVNRYGIKAGEIR